MSGKSVETCTALCKMPGILYGTAWKDTQTTQLVFTAFLYGFRGVDTAAQRKHYREDLVGEGVLQASKQLGLSRGDVWLQTKYVYALTQIHARVGSGYQWPPSVRPACAGCGTGLCELPEQSKEPASRVKDPLGDRSRGQVRSHGAWQPRQESRPTPQAGGVH